MAHTYVFHSVGGALRSVQPLKMRVGHLAGTSSMCAAAAHQGKLGHSRWFSARSFGTSGMSVSVFVRRARNSPVVTQARVYGHRDAVTCAAAAVRPRALGRHTMGHTRRFVSLSRRLHQQGERTSRQQEHRRQRLGFGKIFRVTHFMPPSWSLRALYVLGALHVAALGTWAWWEYGWGEGGPLTFDRPGEHAPKVDVGDVEVSGLSRGEALALQVEYLKEQVKEHPSSVYLRRQLANRREMLLQAMAEEFKENPDAISALQAIEDDEQRTATN